MKKLFNKKILALVLTTVFVFTAVFVPLFAVHAEEEGWISWAAGSIGSELLASTSGILYRVVAMAGQLLQKVSAWILGLSGTLLTFVIDKTVVEMSERIDDITGLQVAWKVFRDVVNMTFIFLILYEAIRMILSINNSAKKVVTNIVIFGILMNFSLFFTKIIIDASNILTISIYNEVVQDSDPNGGIAAPFMQLMGLQQLYQTSTSALEQQAAQPISNEDQLANIFMRSVMSSVFMLITAFIFLAVVGAFITRFIVLVALMILSPLAFGTFAVPQLKVWDKWKKSLLQNAIFPPVFFLMILVTLVVAKGVISTSVQPDWSALVSSTAPGDAALGAIFNWVIIIGMLVLTLMVSKEAGVGGAGAAIGSLNKWQDNIRKKVVNVGKSVAVGTGGYAARGALRASGVAAWDRKLAGSEFAQTAFGSAFRNITTGALTGKKIAGKSVQSQDKELKERSEKYGKLVTENVNKGVKKDTDAFNKDFGEMQRAQVNVQTSKNKQALTQSQYNKDIKEGKAVAESDIAALVATIATDQASLDKIKAGGGTDAVLEAKIRVNQASLATSTKHSEEIKGHTETIRMSTAQIDALKKKLDKNKITLESEAARKAINQSREYLEAKEKSEMAEIEKDSATDQLAIDIASGAAVAFDQISKLVDQIERDEKAAGPSPTAEQKASLNKLKQRLDQTRALQNRVRTAEKTIKESEKRAAEVGRSLEENKKKAVDDYGNEKRSIRANEVSANFLSRTAKYLANAKIMGVPTPIPRRDYGTTKSGKKWEAREKLRKESYEKWGQKMRTTRRRAAVDELTKKDDRSDVEKIAEMYKKMNEDKK
jgi:hypothetical protein